MADKPDNIIGGAWPKDVPGWEWNVQCARCGSSMLWELCEQCRGEGVDGHDCGEDCCACADPEPNMQCDLCLGKCGSFICLSSKEWCNVNPASGRENVKRNTPEFYAVEEGE